MSKTVKEMVLAFRKREMLGVAPFAQFARVGTRAVLVAEEGNYDEDFSALSARKKVATLRTITRLAKACGEKPEGFIEGAGLSNVYLGDQHEATSSLMLLNTPLTKEDILFLLKVQKGMKQSLTFGLAIELVRRRSEPTS